MTPPPIPAPLVWPIGLSALAFALLVGLASGSPVPLYYPLILGLGALGWRHRHGLTQALRRLPAPMILAGYLAVIVEESLAGLMHGLAEGAGPLGLLRSMGQFIAFNLFAFTGIILSLAVWRPRLAFGRWDVFLAAGGWGLFAEGSLQALIANPLAGALLILPNMGVYAVILWPLTLGAQNPATSRPLILRLLTIWATAFALSLPPIALVSWLRLTHPQAFPACAYIAC